MAEQSEKEMLEEYTALVESRLYDVFPPEVTPQGEVVKAAKYSLSAGGKRIRPVLVLAFCEMCGGKRENALDAACAVEYMHTYSLIHDDLPCMDNDDLRRGKPSCHKAFGETTALLAGDMLAILPFETIAGSASIPDPAKAKCIHALAHLCGAEGMIGGQQIDTAEAWNELAGDVLISMYSMKTSALLKAACLCGVYCAGSGDEEKYAEAAAEYAEALGLAFQIVDDILDVTSSPEVLGKMTGSDADNDKHTFVRMYGLAKAGETAKEYTEKAMNALECFEDNEFVKMLTMSLLGRKK
ncbi:MAG: polyprenyl synthetase family protein [Ruminiclostridium sp.]|nr:polyprenyl synthetase family protein [Ruminiclostridium sp.]